VISSAKVPPRFRRKSLQFHGFRSSATFPRVRVTRRITGLHGRSQQNQFLSRANPAEPRNPWNCNDLRRNRRGTAAELAHTSRARLSLPPLFIRRKEGVGEFEELGVGRALSSSAIGRQRAVLGARWAVLAEAGPLPRPPAPPGGVDGSSWEMGRTGNSNPTAWVRRGVSTGVM